MNEINKSLNESIASWNENTSSNLYHKQEIQSSILSLIGVSKTYKVGNKAIDSLKNINLEIKNGEFIAITGESGSGKSTLLHMIGCLDYPTSGQVIIDSIKTNNLKDDELSAIRRKYIGFIFQSFYLQPFLNTKENIEVPAMFTKTKKNEIYKMANLLLERVGLSDRSSHLPNQLSGGQAQRAAIARSLINNPKILLADEPTGNLDSANTKSIINLFETIRQELGTTIIIATHDAEIARHADRTITIKDGVVL